MILIIDYGMGNIHSIKRKLERLKADCMVSSDPMDLEKAEKIILPGVGHFGKAMENLHRGGWIEPLNKAVLVDRKPVLGICLGMQLMTKGSEEGGEARSEPDSDHRKLINGLGWFDAEVIRFQVKDKLRFKVPHTGWNTISIRKDDPVMKDIKEGSEVYFVHSYFIKANDPADILNTTDYEEEFVSGLSKENIFGLQYHPEKSLEVGERIFLNFIHNT